MKNLGSRWTVPDIARTAAARSSFLVAISSERDSDSSSNSIIINDNNSIGSSNSIKVKSRRSNVRSSGSGIDKESSKAKGVTAIDKNKRERKSIGRSAVDVLHELHLSVRSYVTALSNRFDGTARPESTPRHRPLAGKSNGSQHRFRPRKPQPQPPQQQPLYYLPASWDTRTLHFRNC
ncbi:unnamed protein product [Xylocopa violacea]|uniref:Uncharacterized protein n=1 Tax=Xylocopa violacea TaxID=135666 RepID=A0ABP1NEC3_XYLVO